MAARRGSSAGTIQVYVGEVGGELKPYRLSTSATAKDALDKAGLEDGHGDLWVDDAPGKPEQRLRNGQVVTIIPKVEGGR